MKECDLPSIAEDQSLLYKLFKNFTLSFRTRSMTSVLMAA